MSKFAEKAREVIRQAECDVQGLIDSAVRERQYQDVPPLARLAERLVRLLDGTDEALTSRTAVQEADGIAFMQASPGGGDLTGPSGHASGRASPPQQEGPGRAEQAQVEYPRFARDGDALVKIGLSSGSQATYEHRAPKAALDTIVRRALSAYEEGRQPLTAEALSDVHCQGEEGQIPGYQLYLCLGWLKRQGLVARRGRKGYTLPSPESLVADVAEAWGNLDGLEGRSDSNGKTK